LIEYLLFSLIIKSTKRREVYTCTQTRPHNAKFMSWLLRQTTYSMRPHLITQLQQSTDQHVLNITTVCISTFVILHAKCILTRNFLSVERNNY